MACAFQRYQERRRATRTSILPQRRWPWLRTIATWLFVAYLFFDAANYRPFVVTMIGKEVPPSDENPFPFLVGEQRFLNHGLTPSLLLLAAFLGWKAVGVVERFKRANASKLATEVSSP